MYVKRFAILLGVGSQSMRQPFLPGQGQSSAAVSAEDMFLPWIKRFLWLIRIQAHSDTNTDLCKGVPEPKET